MSTILVDHWMDAGELGPDSISHQIHSPDGQYVMTTTYDAATGAGSLSFINTDTYEREKTIPMPPTPHALAYPGYNR
ncbi:MAG: hypothetical protein IBX61_07220 [Thermoleophilia bacterium]|nr:hypothetical protein [Thermoleophilia bacterium]